MTARTIDQTGIVTYWTACDTNAEKLKLACMAVDPGLEKLVPESRTPLAALREALEKTFPEHMIRKLEREGFAVVREHRGQTDNKYNHVAAAWFEGDDVIVDSTDGKVTRSVHENYAAERGILQGAQAGRFMSRVLQEYLVGTPLRPTGGVYWLPVDRAETWEAIGKALEMSSQRHGQQSAVYVLRHAMDENAVRAVRDALINEMNGEADRINAEICKGELGERALATREREAANLIDKVTHYESLLDVELSGIRKALETVKMAAAAASLLAAIGGSSQDTVFAGSDA